MLGPLLYFKDISVATTFIFAFRASASLRVFVTRLWTERSNFRQMKMYYPRKRKSHKLRNTRENVPVMSKTVLTQMSPKFTEDQKGLYICQSVKLVKLSPVCKPFFYFVAVLLISFDIFPLLKPLSKYLSNWKK